VGKTGIKIALDVVIAVTVFVLFHYFGNTAEFAVAGASAFVWMADLWNYPQYDFSHGWLIPLVSLFVLWRDRKRIMQAPRRVFPPGIVVIIAALFLHFTGYRTEQTRLSLFALVLLMWSIPLYLAGPDVAKRLVFPCGYLLFCIPFTFLDAFSFKLRFIGATVSTFLLNGLGISVSQVGTAIHSMDGTFALDVADPCSGLRYFISMAALTAVYAYFTQKTLLRQWSLFLGAVPIAVGANIIRIVGIAVVAKTLGQKTAVGVYHDWSGYIVFLVAVLLMLAIGSLIDRVCAKRVPNEQSTVL